MTRSRSSSATKRSQIPGARTVATGRALPDRRHPGGVDAGAGLARSTPARRARPPRWPRSPPTRARGGRPRCRPARGPGRARPAPGRGRAPGRRAAGAAPRAAPRRRGRRATPAGRPAPAAQARAELRVVEAPDRVGRPRPGSSTPARRRCGPAGASAGLQLTGSKARENGTRGSSTWIHGLGRQPPARAPRARGRRCRPPASARAGVAEGGAAGSASRAAAPAGSATTACAARQLLRAAGPLHERAAHAAGRHPERAQARAQAQLGAGVRARRPPWRPSAGRCPWAGKTNPSGAA